MSSPQRHVVRSPRLPGYDEIKQLVKVWDGTARSAVVAMTTAIADETGTPQSPVDWSDPDEWIDERLTEPARGLARRIWVESGRTVNPRHTYGGYLFINTYQLLVADSTGLYRLTDVGAKFLADDPSTVRAIDEAEGFPELLSILASRSPAKRGDLLGPWRDLLLESSRFKTPATIKDTLRRRLLNAAERGYIAREGNFYTITEKGIGYAAEPGKPVIDQPDQQVLRMVKAYNDAQTRELRERLGQMHPYKFEALIKDLLEAMDYEDVVVTKQSGDKGVDVIANYQFGITQIREVVQVKRHQGSITRPILDQLRGALPYHNANRGTIITLGKFAKGTREAAIFQGAAPITLIDGDKLIELLLKHSVAVTQRQLTLVEVDESYFGSAELDIDALTDDSDPD